MLWQLTVLDDTGVRVFKRIAYYLRYPEPRMSLCDLDQYQSLNLGSLITINLGKKIDKKKKEGGNL